jgi:hypothetical protein
MSKQMNSEVASIHLALLSWLDTNSSTGIASGA